MNNFLTTGQIAKICRVSGRTVAKWIDNRLLLGFKIPGSKHRRVTKRYLVKFMKKNEMPLNWIPK